jgi:CBS-domain-containing membrane protein
LLIEHKLHSLLVADLSGYLVGMVGPAELARVADTVGEVMSPPIWLDYDAPLSDLIPIFMDGHANSVVITDHLGSIFGVVSPMDILKRASHIRCDVTDQKAPQLRGCL